MKRPVKKVLTSQNWLLHNSSRQPLVQHWTGTQGALALPFLRLVYAG